MKSARAHLLVSIATRHWGWLLLVAFVYAGALLASAADLVSPALLFYLAICTALTRMWGSVALAQRATRILPLTTGELDRVAWLWSFGLPVAMIGGSLLVTWSVVHGFSIAWSGQTSLLALYLAASASLALYPRRGSLAPDYRDGINAFLWIAFVFAGAADLRTVEPSPGLVAVAVLGLLMGGLYPLLPARQVSPFRWLPRVERSQIPEPEFSGVPGMLWARLRQSLSTTVRLGLLAAAIALIAAPLGGYSYHRPLSAFAQLLLLIVWFGNWRWMYGFRALRCLPLSTLQLTLLVVGLALLPTVVCWSVQYLVLGVLLSGIAIPVQSLTVLLGVQALGVPWLLGADWLKGGFKIVLFAMLILQVVCMTLAGKWDLLASSAGLQITFAILATCLVVAVALTYREIASGTRAYRSRIADPGQQWQMPPT
jgi:hypothetical protein